MAKERHLITVMFFFGDIPKFFGIFIFLECIISVVYYWFWVYIPRFQKKIGIFEK